MRRHATSPAAQDEVHRRAEQVSRLTSASHSDLTWVTQARAKSLRPAPAAYHGCRPAVTAPQQNRAGSPCQGESADRTPQGARMVSGRLAESPATDPGAWRETLSPQPLYRIRLTPRALSLPPSRQMCGGRLAARGSLREWLGRWERAAAQPRPPPTARIRARTPDGTRPGIVLASAASLDDSRWRPDS